MPSFPLTHNIIWWDQGTKKHEPSSSSSFNLLPRISLWSWGDFFCKFITVNTKYCSFFNSIQKKKKICKLFWHLLTSFFFHLNVLLNGLFSSVSGSLRAIFIMQNSKWYFLVICLVAVINFNTASPVPASKNQIKSLRDTSLELDDLDLASSDEVSKPLFSFHFLLSLYIIIIT